MEGLESVLNALSALFIVNVIHLDTMPVLVDYDIIKSSLAKGYLKELLSHKEPLETIEYVFAKTRIFGYAFQGGSELDGESIKWILSPSYPGY